MAGKQDSILEKKFAEMGLESTPEEFVESLPATVRARVTALQLLQQQHAELEKEFRKERAALEAKYEGLYAPLYSERAEVVGGSKGVPAVEGQTGEDKGVPEFWLACLLKCDITAETIKDKDVEVLVHLQDITSEPVLVEGQQSGFKLKFKFGPNPYFKNQVLEKTYILSPEDDGVLEKAEGTKIDWEPGKDVTIKVMKKKPKKGGKADSKPQIKTEQVPSFFNFFSPPEVPGEEDELEEEEMEELQAVIEQDYEVGATIREKIIPHAVRWYTGEAIEDEPFELGDFDEEDEGEGEDEDDEDDDDDGTPGVKKEVGAEEKPECKQQ